MSDIHSPNLTLPLAASYNTRGQTGFASNFTTGIDQRKINSMYQPVRNAVTGETTLYLAKRPGVEIVTPSFGTTGQTAWLVVSTPDDFDSNYKFSWVFSVQGSNPFDLVVSRNGGSSTIITGATTNIFPQYISKTSISGVTTYVLQVRDLSGAGGTRVFFATAFNSWTEITDSVFVALAQIGKMEHMNGSAFIMTTNARIYNSGINTLATWGAADYTTKQIREDQSVGIAKFGGQILSFGRSSMEVFIYDSVSSNSPLKNVPSLASTIGLVAGSDFNGASSTTEGGHYYAMVNNKLYFVGREGNAKRGIGFYAWDGQRAQKVSNIGIDNILSSLPYNDTNQIWSVNSFFFHGQSAVTIALDLPGATTQRWLMYVPQWNDWFEWNSTVFSPINNGTQFKGIGTNQHRLYSMQEVTASENYQDNGTNYTLTHQFKLPQNGNQRHFMPMAGVVGDTARSASTLGVEFSDDDGQNWTTARNIDMTTDRKAVYRCGSFRNRHVRLTHTGNLDVRLEKFVARVE